MADTGRISISAWERVTAGVRRIEQLPRQLWREPKPPRGRGGGRAAGGSGGGGTVSACGCGGCLGSGTISACGAIGEAPAHYILSLPLAYAPYFGTSVVLSHQSSCTWASDLFADVDLGNGAHDYTWKLVFSGTGIEEAVLTLEDEI